MNLDSRLKSIALSVVLCGCHLHTITPVEETHTAIGETVYRIHLYAKASGKLPPSLDVLPKREGYANQITDAWGARLGYNIAADGTLTLSSLGRDRKPRGVGEDADVISRYRWKDPGGEFIAGDELWIAEAEISGEPSK